MTKPSVTVDKVVLEGSTPKTQIRCTFEADGIGPFSLYLPENASPRDIAQALEHKAFFLENGDLPVMSSPVERQQIIQLHREAAQNVPGLKERE